MYQYIWDEDTGGLLLTTEQSKFSMEPRPASTGTGITRRTTTRR